MTEGRSKRLRASLDGHVPLDALERSHVERLHALTCRAQDPFDRARFEPGHVTASAFVLSPDGASLALVHHAKLDRWLQPGGHVEPDDEDVFAAALRECHEEIGIGRDALAPIVDRPIDVDVHRIPARGEEPAHEHFDVRYALRAATVRLRPASDARDARWVPLEEAEATARSSSIVRVVRKLRALPSPR